MTIGELIRHIERIKELQSFGVEPDPLSDEPGAYELWRLRTTELQEVEGSEE